MSKILYVCFKDPSRCNSSLERKIETITRRITPDNITARPPKIVIDGNVIYGIMNPATSIKERGKSVLLGMAFGDHDNWHEPDQEIPDGSFSLFRSNASKTEIITDIVASRTVWYYHDDEIFIASSSQRAIVMLLGNFELNREVFPWMLSTGSLGPFHSWDSRIKLLPPDSSFTVDHMTWESSLNSNDVVFEATVASDKEHQSSLTSALTDTFKSLKIDFSNWVLPLSGGYDSRGILSLFNLIGSSLKNLSTVTWGIRNAINHRGNDALIGKKLADNYKVEHMYHLTELSNEPIEIVFNRFLVCGEGRIDHLSGYMDGFRIWKTLFEDNVQGIIRGDEGFGWVSVNSFSEVSLRVGISLCSDFANLKDYKELGFPEHDLPLNLKKRQGETLETWRDRLYHQFRMPVVLAALSDLKLPFVEVINPLLSRLVIMKTRTLPDSLRSEKKLFKRIVHSIGPDIEFASSSAIAEAGFILKSESAVKLFKTELTSNHCKSIIPEAFIRYLTENLKVVESSVNKKQIIKSFIKRFIPKRLISKASLLSPQRTMGVNTLAFRVFIICKMSRILEEDSRLFSLSDLSVSETSIN